MEYLMNYLLEVNVVLVLLYGAFWGIARKETFHQLNRVILLAVMVGAFTLPLIQFPGVSVPLPAWLDLSTVDGQGHTTSDRLSTSMTKVELDGELSQLPVSDSPSSKGMWKFNPGLCLLSIYGVITLFFLVRLILQLHSVYRLIGSGQHFWDEGLVQVHLEEKVSPFSFFHWVFFNPDQIQGNQRAMIVEHERVHVDQWHNIDILMGELFVIFLWFNPVAWKLKRSISQNLEFIADEEMLRKGVDRKYYQYSLLSLNAPLVKLSIANHFNYSLIKNRIHMMNIKKSPDHRLIRYMLFFPLLFGLLLISNVTYAQSKSKEKPKKETVPETAAKPEKKASPKVEARSKEKPEKVETIEAKPVIESSASVKTTTNTAVVVEGVSVTEPSVGVAIAQEVSPESVMAGEVYVATSVSTAVLGKVSTAVLVEPAAFAETIGSADPYFDIPVKEDENVFLVIRSDISQKMLDDIKEILREHGINALFSDVRFDDKGRLTSIHVGVKVGAQYQGEMHGYNNGKPLEDPIVMYVMKEGVDKFGVSKGIPGDLSRKIQTSLQKITGLLIIQGDNYFTKGIYDSNRGYSGAQ